VPTAGFMLLLCEGVTYPWCCHRCSRRHNDLFCFSNEFMNIHNRFHGLRNSVPQECSFRIWKPMTSTSTSLTRPLRISGFATRLRASQRVYCSQLCLVFTSSAHVAPTLGGPSFSTFPAEHNIHQFLHPLDGLSFSPQFCRLLVSYENLKNSPRSFCSERTSNSGMTTPRRHLSMPRILITFLIALLAAKVAAQGHVSPSLGPSPMVRPGEEHCTEGYGLCELLHIRFDTAHANK
jgi:hypothetical protein